MTVDTDLKHVSGDDVTPDDGANKVKRTKGSKPGRSNPDGLNERGQSDSRPPWLVPGLFGALFVLIVLAWLASRSGDEVANDLMLSADDYATQQAGGTWSDIFSPDGFFSNVPWLWWLLWFQLVGLFALPITTSVFRRLPGHGVGLTKITGLLLVAMPVWFLASYGLIGFSAKWIWFATLLLGAAGAALAWRQQDTLRSDLAAIRNYWIAAELVFLAAFLFVIAMRYVNPDLWHVWRGGEKPMEMAYFTATARSTTMPPYDPWFGGGHLNYYYLGWYLLAVPTRALRVAPEIAFNLGVASYAALAAVSVHTVTASLAGLAIRNQDAQGKPAYRGRPAVAGLLGVLFFLIVGNLDSLRQTLRHMTEASTSTLGDGTPILGTIADVASGFAVWLRGDLQQLDWWDVSRVNKGSWDITEFPAWTFLFADLHPHMMTMPIFGLMLALVVAYAASMRANDTFRGIWLAAGLGFVLALTRMVHTWDFPTAAALVGAALLFGSLLRRGQSSLPQRDLLVDFGSHAFVALGAYLVLAGPYNRASLVFDNEVQFLPGFTSNLDDFVIHWALFVVAGIGYAVYRWFDLGGVGPHDRSRILFFAANTLLVFAAVHVVVGSVAAWVGATVVLLLALLWRELSQEQPSVAHLAVAGFLALGATIMFGVETVRIGEDIQRMNTVFKFWMQVWHLLAVGAAFGVWWVTQAVRAYGRDTAEADVNDASTRRFPIDPRIIAFGWRGCIGLLVLAALVFAVRAPGPRLGDRFDTEAHDGLAGYAWLDSGPEVTDVVTREAVEISLADDRAMIDWLRQNVDGSPIVVEAVGPSYQWFGRVTALTGLPAVIGWDWHQKQQRGTFAPQVDQRRAAVEAFYRDANPGAADQFLSQYDVEYVIVGSTEAATMSPDVRTMLTTMPTLELVFGDETSSIYRVIR